MSPTKAADFVRTFIDGIRERRVPYRDLFVWKTLTKPVDKYKVNAPHAQAARTLKKEGWALTVGGKVGYVITRGSGRLYERAKPYAMVSKEEVDTEYYVRKQVVPAALRILSMFGVKEEDLLTPKPAKKTRTLVDFCKGS